MKISEGAVGAVLVVEPSPQGRLELRVGEALEELGVKALAPERADEALGEPFCQGLPG